MKVAIITDTHFGARNDSLPMQASMRKFFEQVFFPTLDKHGITRVIHAGDYVDRRKYINYQTAHFIRTVYREGLAKRNIEEDVLVGNHDIFLRHSTEINAVRELYEDDSEIRLYTGPVEIDIDGCGILMLPWITDNNRERSLELIKTSKCPVVIGHLELSGFQMFKGMIAHEGMSAGDFDRFELVMSGHYHHKSQQGPVHYLGAPYPMIWSDYRDARGFHIFDTDTKELTFIENPYSLFARIVYDDVDKDHAWLQGITHGILAPDSPYKDAYVKVIVKSKSQPYWFDVMMDSLYKAGAQDVLVVDDIIINDDDEEVTETNTDVDTLTLIREFVDSLSISCDKDELYQYLQNKYNEAMAATQSARLS